MIKEVTAAEFKAEIAEGLVLVDFYSKTCGPCKMLSINLNAADKEIGDKVKVVKVVFEENPDLAKEYGVTGYPTLIVMKDGAEKERKSGLQQKTGLIKMLQAYM